LSKSIVAPIAQLLIAPQVYFSWRTPSYRGVHLPPRAKHPLQYSPSGEPVAQLQVLLIKGLCPLFINLAYDRAPSTVDSGVTFCKFPIAKPSIVRQTNRPLPFLKPLTPPFFLGPRPLPSTYWNTAIRALMEGKTDIGAAGRAFAR